MIKISVCLRDKGAQNSTQVLHILVS